MHCFQVKLGSDTGTVIFGVEYFKSLKGQENLATAEKSTTENPRRKRPIFVMDNFFFFGKYGIQSTDEMTLKRAETRKCPPVYSAMGLRPRASRRACSSAISVGWEPGDEVRFQ